MQLSFLTFGLLTLGIVASGEAPSFELTRDFWNNPNFVRSFMGDYGFRSEIEPRIDKSETFVLREVIAKSENQLEEAIAYLEEKVSPKSSAGLDFALGTLYFQANRLTRSSDCYTRAIEKFPSFLRAHKNLGLVLLSLGKLNEASQSLSRAISLGETDGSTFIALGYCHLSLNRLVSAENAYRMGLLLFPDSKDGLNGLINCLAQANRYQETLALLEELLEKEPSNTAYLSAKASALASAGENEQAVVTLDLLRRLGQLQPNRLVDLGDMYHNLNLYDLSLSAYQEALDSVEKLSLPRYVRVAQTLIGRASYEEGFAYLEKIDAEFGKVYSNEQSKTIRLLKAEVLQLVGKDDEAYELLNELVKDHPLEGGAFLQLGTLAWKAKKYDRAELHFERATKSEASAFKALIEHARMLVALGNYNKACELLRRSLIIEPQPRVERYLRIVQNLAISARTNL